MQSKAPGINRNILECKFFTDKKMVAHAGVLIETYWNVNSTLTLFAPVADLVLIETYWNVNVTDWSEYLEYSQY